MRCLIKWAFEHLKGGGTPAPFFLSEKLAGKSAKVIRGEKKKSVIRNEEKIKLSERK